jgi:hypothetical protein
LNNDSDPNGYTIALQKKLLAVDPGLKAHTHGKFVLLTAPAAEGAYQIRYQITNGQGGVDSAFVQVIVDKNAKPQYPTAVDQVLEPDRVADKSAVKVNVRDGATNPSGLVSDLKASVTGANASKASVGDNGSVTVHPSDTRMAITYELTDPTTGLSADAFIVVPPKGDETAPPRIKPSLPRQIVESGGSKTWKLSDIIDVPSHRAAKLTGASGVTATNSNGKSPYDDDQTITFTGAKGYRGPAAITFKVNDGHDAGQSKDRVTSLVLPLTVGNPDQSDVPPTFTPPNEQIQAGEASLTIDLRSSSFHPNPEVLNKLTYSGLSGASNGIEASLSGSNLTMSAPLGVQPGSSATLKFTVSSGKFTIDGSVNVKVVSSTRPIASQKSIPATDIRRGKTATEPSAAGDKYWVNPFPGKPLTITSAKLSNAPKGVTVTYTASSISVSAASGADIGVASVTYTVQDATKDPKRVATGQYNVTIHDVPGKPDAPTATATDGQAIVNIARAPASNGKDIDAYEISNGSKTISAKIGPNTFTGLTNGTAYRFTVRAHNADGWGQPSAASAAVTPYGKPAQGGGLNIQKNSTYAKSSFTLSWNGLSGAATGGGTASYQYDFDGQGWKSAGHATSVTTASQPAGTYRFSVRAVNDGGGGTGPTSTSGSVTINNQPPPDPSVTNSKGNGPVYSGTCTNGCFYFKVSIKDFSQGSHTVKYFCNGNNSGYTDTVNAGSDGTGSMNSQNQSQFNCGYPNTYVTVDGHKSNVADFRP